MSWLIVDADETSLQPADDTAAAQFTCRNPLSDSTFQLGDRSLACGVGLLLLGIGKYIIIHVTVSWFKVYELSTDGPTCYCV